VDTVVGQVKRPPAEPEPDVDVLPAPAAAFVEIDDDVVGVDDDGFEAGDEERSAERIPGTARAPTGPPLARELLGAQGVRSSGVTPATLTWM
jgi:hypothetical protein